VDVHHLVGAREAAERLQLPRVQAFHQYRRHHPDFPAAIYWTTQGQGGTGVWYWPDVWHWARSSGLRAFANIGPLRCTNAPLRRSRRIDVDDLVGSKEIAERLGLRFVQRVHILREEDAAFPAPVFSSTGGRWGKNLWAWPDVWRWAKHSGRSFGVELGRSPAAAVRRFSQP
jgi:hypothetical protein